MASIIRNFAERLVRNRTMRRRLPKPFGRRPIWVSPDARLNYLNFGDSAYDNELLFVASTYVRPGDFVLDVGANVGEFALAAAHCAGKAGGALAVEPDPFLGALLVKTTNEPDNSNVNLRVLSSAVSSKNGLAVFLISARGRASNALASSGNVDMGGNRYEMLVPTTTIDEITSTWRAPNFIKVDVEGAEYMVLDGARQTLGAHRPLVFIEIRKDQDSIKELFRELRYLPFDPRDHELRQPIADFMYNTLLVPEEKVAALRAR